MPALKSLIPPLEALQPSRRRVWAHPELQSHSLLALTPGELYLAPPTGAPRPEFVAAAEGDGNLDELFGPLATVIDLASVRHVKLDLLANTLWIDYSRGGRAMSRITLVFTSTEAADSCFSRIWRRLGSGVRLQSNQRDGWRLARLPLALLAATLLITAALSLAITTSDSLGSNHAAASLNLPGEEQLGHSVLVPGSPLVRLVGWMDWRTVCLLGGAAAAATQVWLYRRLTQPPVSLEVIRI